MTKANKQLKICSNSNTIVIVLSRIGPYQLSNKLINVQLVTLKLCEDSLTRSSDTKVRRLKMASTIFPKNPSSPVTYLK